MIPVYQRRRSVCLPVEGRRVLFVQRVASYLRVFYRQ